MDFKKAMDNNEVIVMEITKTKEGKQVSKKQLYIGSAVAVTTGMGIIKLAATVINKTVAFVLGHVL